MSEFAFGVRVNVAGADAASSAFDRAGDAAAGLGEQLRSLGVAAEETVRPMEEIPEVASAVVPQLEAAAVATNHYGEEAEAAGKKTEGFAEKFDTLWSAGRVMEETEAKLLKLIDPMHLLETAADAAFETLMMGPKLAIEGTFMLAEAVNDVGQKFDRLKVQMNAVFGPEGGGEAALEWAGEFEKKTPLAIEEVAERLIRLKRAGFDPLNEDLGLMQKLGDTAQALGMSFDSIVRPLAKMNASGQVGFKDLIQVAQEGIPIFEILQEKTGLTVEQLRKLGPAGLEGKAVVDLVVDALGNRYVGAMDNAMQTSEVAWKKIGDVGEEAARKIADAGIWKVYTDHVVSLKKDLEELVDSPVFGKFAKAISDQEAWAIQNLETQITAFTGWTKETMKRNVVELSTFVSMMTNKDQSYFQNYMDWYTARANNLLSVDEKNLEKTHQKYVQFLENRKKAAEDADKDAAAKEETLFNLQEKNRKEIETAAKDAAKADKEMIEDATKALIKALKERAAEEKKRAAEQKRLAEQSAEMQINLADKWANHQADLQKNLLSDAVKAEEERMAKVKSAMESRSKWEKMFWDYRRDLAETQFNREQAWEATLHKRRLEDEATSLGRGNEDVKTRILDYLDRKSFSSYDPEVDEYLRYIGLSPNALGTDNNRKSVERWFQDQETELRRDQEDQTSVFKEGQEDVKRDREFMRKQEDLRFEEQTKAMIELATSLKNFKAQVKAQVEILNSSRFVRGFMREVFKEAKVTAKVEPVEVAGS